MYHMDPVLAEGRVQPRGAIKLLTAGLAVVLVVLVGFIWVTAKAQITKNNEEHGITLSAADLSGLRAAGLRASTSVVNVDATFAYQGELGAGTGIVLSATGLILTDNHVISGASTLRVVSASGHKYAARVVGYDRSRDIAILQLSGAHHLTPLTFSSEGVLGQPVVGVGNAEGRGGAAVLEYGSITNTKASVVATDPLTGVKEVLPGLLSTNAAIVPGDSGGPLVGLSGGIVGLDTAASGVGTSGAQGYATPESVVRRVVAAIERGRDTSQVHVGATAFLGVLCVAKAQLGHGVIVEGAASGSPAEGVLTKGDVLTSVGGVATKTINNLTDAILNDRPGQRVVISWTHGTDQHQRSVVLAAGPAQ